MKQVPGYTLVRTEDCPEQHGTLTVLTHDISGATVLLVENDDENKAFGIGFGTFPSDDTGVFHILEHSVLAGSEKYPVTSPFLQLLISGISMDVSYARCFKCNFPFFSLYTYHSLFEYCSFWERSSHCFVALAVFRLILFQTLYSEFFVMTGFPIATILSFPIKQISSLCAYPLISGCLVSFLVLRFNALQYPLLL